MSKIVSVVILGLIATPAFASTAAVPEMDMGAGAAAIALLAGIAAIIREKTKKSPAHVRR